MQLSLLQENFNLALQNVSRFVSSKSQLPILSNILISTDEGRLKLSATNLEVGINYWIGAKIEKEGSTAIPNREITEFISYLSSGKIDLSLDDKNLLKITSSRAESTFATIPAADFPVLPSLDPKTAFDINLSLFNQAISQIAFSAAADDTRPVLTAVLCQFAPNNITLVTTDGFRLSQKIIKLVEPLSLKDDQPVSFLIPQKTLLEITKLSKTAKKLQMGLTLDGHQLVFVLEDLELVSRLIEGDYPDYQRIIPESFSKKIFINKAEFAQAVKIASVFAQKSANVVKFSLQKSKLILSANAPQLGQNQASVEAKFEGDPLEIAFNYKFVSDFLTVCKGEEIIIELNEPLTPGFFHDQSDPNFTHIIMPVRIQD